MGGAGWLPWRREAAMQDPGADPSAPTSVNAAQPSAPEAATLAPPPEASAAPPSAALAGAPTAPAEEPPPTVLPRDALVFVPSMTRSWSSSSFHAVATDIALSLNTLSQGVRFTVNPSAAPAYTTSGSALGYDIVTISRATIGTSTEHQTPIIDVYGLE